MRQEIEVKARITDMKAIEEKLRALGCTISESITQDDTVFVDYSEAYDQMSPGKNFLRIRKSNDKILFTVKQPQQGELDCFEHETEISNAEEMEKAILLMGYHKAITVYKMRRKTNYGEYEICLDEVKDLGSFIEVEKITEGEDPIKVQNELFDFLKSLGVKEEDRVERGYDTLLYLARVK